MLLINAFLGARVSGVAPNFGHVITLDITDERLAKIGITNNGRIDLNNQGPVARDDSYTANANTAIVINPIANDFDPDGQSFEITDFTNPFQANLKLLDDGTLLYKPHHNAQGNDTFDYWITDENGEVSKAVVVVEIYDI